MLAANKVYFLAADTSWYGIGLRQAQSIAARLRFTEVDSTTDLA